MLLFRNETTDGFGSIQLLRYWTFVRAAQQSPLEYHRAFFIEPTPQILDLLQVEWLIAGANLPPQADWVPVRQQDGWILYRRGDPSPRVSLIGRWSVVASPDLARDMTTSRSFDPSEQVILERDPGLHSAAGGQRPGSAHFVWLANNAARIDVDAPAPGIALVRNSYDPNWRATVDGRPAPVLAADYILQGIPVGSGHHTIVLSYRDTSIGAGLAGSALSILALLGSSLAMRRRRRTPWRSRSAPVPAAERNAVIGAPSPGSTGSGGPVG
jgi:hypothetical protein